MKKIHENVHLYVQVMGLTDRKAASSLDDGQQGNFGEYTPVDDGEVVVPVDLRQSQLQDFNPLASQEILVPLQVNIYIREHACHSARGLRAANAASLPTADSVSGHC